MWNERDIRKNKKNTGSDVEYNVSLTNTLALVFNIIQTCYLTLVSCLAITLLESCKCVNAVKPPLSNSRRRI